MYYFMNNADNLYLRYFDVWMACVTKSFVGVNKSK